MLSEAQNLEPRGHSTAMATQNKWGVETENILFFFSLLLLCDKVLTVWPRLAKN